MGCGPRLPESAATLLGNPLLSGILRPRQQRLKVEVAGRRRRSRRTTSTICRDGLPTLDLIATCPTQQRPFLSASSCANFLFREKCFRHERIQMIRPVHHATTTGKIPDDGFMAPANSLCNLSAGTALKPHLDCQTPQVVAWTISFHSALTKCDIASSNIVALQSVVDQPRGAYRPNQSRHLSYSLSCGGRELSFPRPAPAPYFCFLYSI